MSAAAIPANDKRRRALVTPEGIALNLMVASRAARVSALALDLFLIGLLMIVSTWIAIWLLGGVASIDQKLQDSQAHALQFLMILWFAMMFLLRNAWFMFFELGPRGATPGKRAIGIRIAARDGGRLTAEMVLARNLLRDIELFLPISFLIAAPTGDTGRAGLAAAIWFLVFALFPFFNRDSLRAGDLIAGTWVVEAPKRKLEAAMSLGSAARGEASETTGAAYRFGEADLAVYGEYELQMLERVLRENRSEALVAVQDAICRKIGWNPGAGDERTFLEAYYTQLRARLEGGMRLGRRKADKWAGNG